MDSNGTLNLNLFSNLKMYKVQIIFYIGDKLLDNNLRKARKVRYFISIN